MSSNHCAAILTVAGLCAAATARAEAPAPITPTLGHCAAIGAPADRLACYDALAGRSPAAAQAAAAAPPAAATSTPPSTSLLAPKNAVPAETAVEPSSLLSKYWELDPADKRGIFNFVGYHPNYVLPVHYTTRINRAPSSPTQTPVLLPDYKREEAKFQLSLRTKVAQDVLLPGADVWVAFTQQAFWQIWNGADSKPFRNTDYQPEAIYLVPTPIAWRALPLGWQWRYTQLGLAHQSNGQSDPLSRSWNRVYLGAGFERGDWSLTGRWNQRLNEPVATDNNPDLQHYIGRGEFQLNWAHDRQTASLLLRSNLNTTRRGALQFEWTYPVFRDQPNGLRWYAQVFSGYGETLTDYNFFQSSVGLGVTFLQF
ncbi:MAG TPA: phospholipase A [Burkholderiaceae bacterium]